MNQQPFQTPPHWWSPSLSPRWIQFWRPLRRRRAMVEHGLQSVEVRGAEHLRAAIDRRGGVLITPNHPTHADPFALLDAADQLGATFHFMTAWQVFAMTHWLGRRVLRQHGCFSINREGHDLRAYRQAVHILQRESSPLVMFPEGEVFHLNDRTTNFRQGAATIALRAAKRGNRPVACVPCSIRFQYVSDPLPELLTVMDRLEERVRIAAGGKLPLERRIERVGHAVLSIKETEHFGAPRRGTLQQRLSGLRSAILARLEARYRVTEPCPTVPERVKELRRRAIASRESASRGESVPIDADMKNLFLVMQLFSYPPEYLAGHPSIERLAETVDKLEEDILQVSTARKRGLRRAIVQFGEPLLAQPCERPHAAAPSFTAELQRRVQQLLDEPTGPRPSSPSLSLPSPASAETTSLAVLPTAA